jgi:hypothetical protein
MENFSLHSFNILIHVIAGTTALLLGVVALISKKGRKLHNRFGRLFLYCLFIVVTTGFIGVFVFERNSILLVVTVSSTYYGFSGYRTLQTKSNIPKFIDVLAGILSILAVTYFLYYFQSSGLFWSPTITYSSVGALVFVVSYDFLKYLIPRNKYGKLWLYEHIYKMISAFTALLSAFSGTVLDDYQPYSQFLPSVFGFSLALSCIVFFYWKNSRAHRII